MHPHIQQAIARGLIKPAPQTTTHHLIPTRTAAKILGLATNYTPAYLHHHNIHPTTIPGKRQHHWPKTAVHHLATTRHNTPTTCPPGYCTTTQATKIISRTPSALTRYTTSGHLHPIHTTTTTPGTTHRHPITYYNIAELRHLATKLNNKKNKTQNKSNLKH